MTPDQLTRRSPSVPNWTVVAAPAAKQALDSIIGHCKHQSRAERLTSEAEAVLAAILAHYGTKGCPPSLSEIAGVTATTTASVRECLDLLRQLDFVIIDPDSMAIRGAYPFTERATPHKVTFRRTGTTLMAMCAIDALGAGAMCRENAVITSTCGLCGLSISSHVEDSGMTLSALRPSSSVIWAGLGLWGECAADTVCTEFLFFCCDDHLRRWQALGDRSQGHRLSAEEAFQVGKALFMDRAMLGT
jgi:Alkylmercury lyase